MATSAEQEQEGFWEELEKLFDRQIPIKNEVRYAIDTVFKRLDVFDPEKREKVIDAAEHIAYEIVIAAFRGEDAEEVQKEVIKNMTEEDKKKAAEEGSQMSPRVATNHRERDIFTPGDFLEMFNWVKKLPEKYEQKEASKKEREKVHYLIYGKIYRDILEKIIEELEEYFPSKTKFEDLLKEPFEKINSKYSVDTETLEFYGLRIDKTLVMTMPKKKTVTWPKDFQIAKEELITKATGIARTIFERRRDKPGKVDPIIPEDEMEELTEKIDLINYPTYRRMDLGLFVDYSAYGWWKKDQSSHEVRLFNDFVKEVRGKLYELPDLVKRWGNWAYEVSEQLKSKESPSQ